ncbi:MAG: PD-(D/E)XK nuclease domain-containing protein [Deltaproteobacteria bacterium]|jgi:hypothetical protein|nr:PD-(D/E)XK nuclease domain-containing protein [Deltaproteobacteria bacterium]
MLFGIKDLMVSAKGLHEAMSQKNVEDIEGYFKYFLSCFGCKLHVAKVSYYQTLFKMAMAMANQPLIIEEPFGGGPIDASVDIPGIGVFIVEMKYLKAEITDTEDKVSEDLNKLSLEAMRQIDYNGYALKYYYQDKKIYKMALVVYKRTRVKAVIKEEIQK